MGPVGAAVDEVDVDVTDVDEDVEDVELLALALS